MTKEEVHQFLPSFDLPDAVGNHTVKTRDALKRFGFGGAIWSEHISGELSSLARFYIKYERSRAGKRGSNLLLYQASTGSPGVVDFLMRRKEQLTLWYHNITPGEYFAPYDPVAAASLQRGRRELQMLSTRINIALACSEFNARELKEWGIPDVRIVQPYLSDAHDTDPDPGFAQRLRSEKKGIDILFVGRIVPNKGHFNLLRTFSALRSDSPSARLFIVGRWGPESYMRELFRLREKMGNEGCIFTGALSDSHLAALYNNCDVFLSLSEHEGFGLPLIEAMRSELPVVAYAAGGVRETLGGKGILLETLDPAFIAETVWRVSRDDRLRKEIIDQQKQRAAEIEAIPRDSILLQAVRDLLDQ